MTIGVVPHGQACLPALQILCVVACAAAMIGCSSSVRRPDNGVAGDQRATAHLAREHFAPALRLARASRANGDLASAINLYQGVIVIQPADAKVLVEYGDTLAEAGSFDEAIEVYGKVARDSDARLDALLGLEQTYLRLGEPAQALKCAEEAHARAPLDHRVLVSEGVILDTLGEHKEAQALYRAALAKAPHDVAARNDLALSLAITDQFDDAVDILNSMAQSSNASPRIRQNLALVYGLKGDAERARALSRVDLDTATTEGNLRFFQFARGEQGK